VESLEGGQRSCLTIVVDFEARGIGKLLVPLVVRRQVKRVLLLIRRFWVRVPRGTHEGPGRCLWPGPSRFSTVVGAGDGSLPCRESRRVPDHTGRRGTRRGRHHRPVRPAPTSGGRLVCGDVARRRGQRRSGRGQRHLLPARCQSTFALAPGGRDRDLAPLRGRSVGPERPRRRRTDTGHRPGRRPGRQVPQAVVPTDAWQAAETSGPWTLVGCTVSPAFTFDGFELAPPGWSPA
jgi:Cupin superfamily (DUF985)